MHVVFIHPPVNQHPSGGHVYNRHLIAEARHFPLESMPLAPDGLLPERVRDGAIVLWDSLFLECLARGPLPSGSAVHGLLVHYLPFLNPCSSGAARARDATLFDEAAAAVRFFVATGRTVARWLEDRYPGQRVFLAEPGIHPAFPAARRAGADVPSGGPLRIATVANLLPAKGHAELLTVLETIGEPPWEWHLVGAEEADPGYARRFRRRLAAPDLAGRVVRHGVLAIPALARLLAACDLYACTSRFEAYGMALAEAVAVGLPAVSTAVGEAARIVRHGETGFVVPVADQEALRAALLALLTDDELRQRFRLRLPKETPRGWNAVFDDFVAAIQALA